MAQARIGIIGGTGLYDMEGMTGIEEVHPDTPFGKPSDSIVLGSLDGVRLAFLPRHGRGHRLNPGEVPYRANIFALKALGVEWVIAINSAGSFREEICPGSLVIPDQIIDRTTRRTGTFFGEGMVVHVSFADPFCPDLSDILYRAAVEAGASVTKGGTFICMEGPLFSTRAESRLYQSWGASIVGMTVLPEAKLAREAELCYASVVCVSDYDCWLERREPVTAEMIIGVIRQNVSTSKKIIKVASQLIPSRRSCECKEALKTAIVTAPEYIPAEKKKELKLLIGKYVK
ncbi:MAG: mtaP [Dehalococcoidia bacterium]|nr:mtaP [Dehalococcoidia bacterium]